MKTPPASLARFTGFLLAWVAASSTERYARALADVGMTPYQHGVLTLLESGGPQMQARLSEQLDVFKPVMVRIVSELESNGWAERRAHPVDGRAVAVHLLPAGRRALRRAGVAALEASDETFAALSADERRAMHDLLAKVARAHT